MFCLSLSKSLLFVEATLAEREKPKPDDTSQMSATVPMFAIRGENVKWKQQKSQQCKQTSKANSANTDTTTQANSKKRSQPASKPKAKAKAKVVASPKAKNAMSPESGDPAWWDEPSISSAVYQVLEILSKLQCVI